MRFRAALEQWPRDGVPANPRAWLVSAGRFKAIDAIRRRARFDALGDDAAMPVETPPSMPHPRWDDEDGVLEDDRLRLVFTCCHPALAPDAQVALTLREVCGLATEDIAQRLPGAARRRSPSASCAPRRRFAMRAFRTRCRRAANLPERLDAVLRVIYLVFNEGYAASSGETLTRPDLSAEAIRLGRLLVELLPEPEAMGLLALMLLHESRRAARTSAVGRHGAARRAGPRPAGTATLIDEGARWCERALRVAPLRALYAAGRDRGRACRGGRRRPRPTGRRSSGCTTCCCERRAVAGGGAQPRGRGRDARRPGRRAGADRRASSRAASWPTITWRTQHAPTSAGGWAEPRRRAPPTNVR